MTKQFIRGIRVWKTMRIKHSIVFLWIFIFEDIENVYTQHIPLVKDLAEQLIYGKLKDTCYPNAVGSNDQIKQNQRLQTNTLNQLQQQGQATKLEVLIWIRYFPFPCRSTFLFFFFVFRRPSEIIIYIIGGITYEESLHIHMMNSQGARIILGGSYIHNFTSVMEEVLAGSASTSSINTNESSAARRRWMICTFSFFQLS